MTRSFLDLLYDQAPRSAFDDLVGPVAAEQRDAAVTELLGRMPERVPAGRIREVGVEWHDDLGWIAVEVNGTTHRFDSENAACDFQLGWRAAKNLNMVTGEVRRE